MVYRIYPSPIAIPVTITQRVVARQGARLIVEQRIDDGFVEPLDLRLRIDVDRDGASRLVSVARLQRGVELPFGTAAYRERMALLEPPVRPGDGPVGKEEVRLSLRGAPVQAERSSYEVSVDGERAALTLVRSPSFPWGALGQELRDGRGNLLYAAEVVAVDGELTEPVGALAARARTESDYEAWEAEPRPLEPAVVLAALARAEADYEAWDAESRAAAAPATVAAIYRGSEADYEAWDSETPAHELAVPPAAHLAAADEAEQYDEE